MDIHLIQQREIEARMAAALVAGYADAIGRDRAVTIAGQSIGRMARKAGRNMRPANGVGTLEDLAGVARDVWARDGALTIDFMEISPAKLRFNVTRCRYAELYEGMDVKGLGYYFSCCRDAAFARGFNPAIRMKRTQTIMQGADYCDFHFYLEPGGPGHEVAFANNPYPTRRGPMPRFFRITAHIFVFLIGLAAAGFTNFWDWGHFRGLVLPVVAAGFFFYLILFLATGEYRIFKPSDPGS
jgi:hypothetical protein